MEQQAKTESKLKKLSWKFTELLVSIAAKAIHDDERKSKATDAVPWCVIRWCFVYISCIQSKPADIQTKRRKLHDLTEDKGSEHQT